MSDVQAQSATAATFVEVRAIPAGFASWPEYKNIEGMPWCTEPEINDTHDGRRRKRGNERHTRAVLRMAAILAADRSTAIGQYRIRNGRRRAIEGLSERNGTSRDGSPQSPKPQVWHQSGRTCTTTDGQPCSLTPQSAQPTAIHEQGRISCPHPSNPSICPPP